MKIQIVSDLHLEFPENRQWIADHPLLAKGDILLLAGDIVCNKYRAKARKFYSRIENEFKFIIQGMGNHEFYHGEISYAYPSYGKRVSSNHIRLNNRSYVYDGVKFIVSVLWSEIAADRRDIVESSMNDYGLIKHRNLYKEKIALTSSDTLRYHAMSVKYITEELAAPFAGDIVVMTHHLPSLSCISEQFLGDELNSAYASDLDALISGNPQIKYWVCGHCHDHHRVKVGSTEIIRNPLGYVQAGEHGDFECDLVLEL